MSGLQPLAEAMVLDMFMPVVLASFLQLVTCLLIVVAPEEASMGKVSCILGSDGVIGPVILYYKSLTSQHTTGLMLGDGFLYYSMRLKPTFTNAPGGLWRPMNPFSWTEFEESIEDVIEHIVQAQTVRISQVWPP